MKSRFRAPNDLKDLEWWMKYQDTRHKTQVRSHTLIWFWNFPQKGTKTQSIKSVQNEMRPMREMNR